MRKIFGRGLSLFASSLFFCAGLNSPALAMTYSLPTPDNNLIGEIKYASTNGQTPGSIVEHYNVGLNAIIAANPGATQDSLPPTNSLKIASKFLLPPLPRKGIVINLPEMRMYYFPEGRNVVMTYPVGIGKIGKTIPVVNTAIAKKVVNPVWIPPQDIREFNKQQGIDLPKLFPAGPDNPLGPYGIYLRVPTYLIHSTIFPDSIGRRASFGCIRMNEGDIKQFFPIVEAGTPVEIVDMPTKVAWEGEHLFIESHAPLEERRNLPQATIGGMVHEVRNAMPQVEHRTIVDWPLLIYLSKHPDGVPHEVGVKV